MGGTPWLAEDEETLKKLWKEGYTKREIKPLLNREYTLAAIGGKAARLDLERREGRKFQAKKVKVTVHNHTKQTE